MRRIRMLEPFHRNYEFVATRTGLLGNALFVLGSVLFFFMSGWLPKLCWLLGSVGMLVRAVGRIYTDDRIEHERTHGRDGGEAMAAARRGLDTSPQ